LSATQQSTAIKRWAALNKTLDIATYVNNIYHDCFSLKRPDRRATEAELNGRLQQFLKFREI